MADKEQREREGEQQGRGGVVANLQSPHELSNSQVIEMVHSSVETLTQASAESNFISGSNNTVFQNCNININISQQGNTIGSGQPLPPDKRIPAIQSRETEEVNQPILQLEEDHNQREDVIEELPDSSLEPHLKYLVSGEIPSPLCGLQLFIEPNSSEGKSDADLKKTCSAIEERLKDTLWTSQASNCLDLFSRDLLELYASSLIKLSWTDSTLRFHLHVSKLSCLEKLQNDIVDGSIPEKCYEKLLKEEMKKDIQKYHLGILVTLDQGCLQEVLSYLITEGNNAELKREGLQSNEYFCDYCKVYFEEKWQHDDHIDSDDHKEKTAPILSSEAFTKVRKPPLTSTNGNFLYCTDVADKSCQFMGKIGSENQCPFAHTTGELNAWQEIHRHRLEVIQTRRDQSESLFFVRDSEKGSRESSRWADIFSRVNDKAKSLKSVGSIKYSTGEKIGEGSRGSHIFAGKFENKDVAVKKMLTENFQRKSEIHQVKNSRTLCNVLKILHIEENQECSYIVTELCEYDLKTVIEDEKNPVQENLTLGKRIKLCLDILKGLKSLHSIDIIHGDLKPNSILLGLDGDAKIIVATAHVNGNNVHWDSICWLPCEHITSENGQVVLKKESDIKVAGYLMYYILSNGHHPFEATSPYMNDTAKLISNVKEGKFCLSCVTENSSQCKTLLTRMLDKNMSKRPCIDDCIKEMNGVRKSNTSSTTDATLSTENIKLSMENVVIDCKSKFIKHLPGKNPNRKQKLRWILDVKCQTVQLRKIYLWHSESDNFSLSDASQSRQRKLDVEDIQKDRKGTHIICVDFESKTRGAFHQWLILDFGCKEVLCQQFLVWVGPEFSKHFPVDDESTLWNLNNHEVVKFPPFFDPGPLCEKLEEQYPPPEEVSWYPKLMQLERENFEDYLYENFKDYFHEMVYEEEREQIKQLKKFNGFQEIVVKEKTDSPVRIKLGTGQLFGELKWKTHLDDSEASQILKSSVHLALLKFEGFPETIYEAEIVAGMGYDLREVDHFVVKLSQQCVTDQALKPGRKEIVNVQFKVDRKKFCFYHYAIDSLRRKDLLFPPRNMFPRFLQVEDMNNCDDLSLHHRQETAKRSLSSARNAVPFGYGPSLIIGPCGTGKTFVLARTVKDILEQDPNSKLFICTHSNSAADVFTNEVLRGFNENAEISIIRVYETDIDIEHVDEEILQNWSNYDRQGRQLTIPSAEDVRDYRVVVTTFLTAVHFVAISQLHCQFTHIFIDEAGQALETETMIPLGLAGPRTVVVLAGDHKQMRPKITSRRAQEYNFQRSMLERLYSWSKRNNCNNYHFLTENYRMLSPELLAFIGQHCYHVKNLHATAKNEDQQLSATTRFHPSMKFSGVSGKENQKNVSYSNEMEAKEIVQQVLDLLREWPSDSPDPSIGVLTSYESQVQLLKKSFPKKFLRSVNICTVKNTQGQQFDVVLISTVRTRHTIGTDNFGDPEYYGVLSDEDELITALTRARRLLWVVGDTKTLCSVGTYQNIWKKYVQVCAKMNTLLGNPPALAEERGDNRINRSDILSFGLTGVNPEPLQPLSSHNFQTNMEDEENIVSDEIISDLEKEIKEEISGNDAESSVQLEGTSLHQEVAGQECASRPPPSQPLRKNTKFRRPNTNTTDKRNLIPLRFDYSYRKGGTYGLDVQQEQEEIDEEIAKNIQNTKDFPKEYCKAMLQFAENDTVNAIPLSDHSNGKIVISSKRKRNRALDGDQVVVRKWSKQNVEYGEVMCILKRAEDLKLKKMVCTLDSDNLMCPVGNSFFPRMVIYPGDKKKSGKEDDVTIGLFSISPPENIQHEKNVEVKSTEKSNKLFVVCYLKWEGDHLHPMGIVIEELPSCDCPDVGFRILKLIHGVSEMWPPSVREEMEPYSEKWTIPRDEMKERARYDFRDKCVFTIGSESFCSDFAIHIEKLDGGEVKLGLHLADVPFFISKGTLVDNEAFRRGCSFSATHCMPSTNMLPDILSTNLCIFHENQERLSLSIILTFDQYQKVSSVVFCRSVVCCKQNLSFENVENLILNKNEGKFDFNGQVMQNVGILYQFVNQFSLPAVLNGAETEDQINFPLAYGLVQRLRIITNAEVTKKLKRFSEQGIPVCHQLPPKKQCARLWYNAFDKDVHGIPNFPTSHFTEGGRATSQKHISVLQSTWEELQQIHEGEKDKLVEIEKLLVCNEGFPQRVAALANLGDITPQDEFIFTNVDVERPVRHFSKQEKNVHPFLTPVRSFMDLVVLRMLIACIESTNNPYERGDLAHIAYHCTKQTRNAQNYKNEAKMLMFAFKVQVLPHHLQAVVHSSNEEELKFCYPSISFLKKVKSSTIVPFQLLKPVEAPVHVKEVSIEVNWKNRIYIYGDEQNVKNKSNICTKQHVMNIPTLFLEKMSTSVQQRDYQSLEDLKDDWNGIQQRNTDASLTLQSQCQSVVEVISCEGIKPKLRSEKIRKYVEFGRDFTPGDVVNFQLCSGIEQGLPVPRIQLLKMTAKLDLCLEHRSRPVQCFTEIAEKLPQKFRTVEDYVEGWLPMLRMMVAYSTIMSDETIYIHNVEVTWTEEKEASTTEIFGHFALEKKWCFERLVKFSTIPKKKKVMVPGFTHPTGKFLLSDFVCVRVPKKRINHEQRSQLKKLTANQNVSLKTGVPIPDTSTVVLHGVAGVTNDEKSASYDVMFQVTQTSHNITKCLFDGDGEVNVDVCTVELIPKPEPEKRMEAALANLTSSKPIIQSMVIQRSIKEMAHSEEGRKIKCWTEETFGVSDESMMGIFQPEPPNRSQTEALRLALSQPFTVIHGPPGTGKTRTGAYLTCLFMKINKKTLPKTLPSARPQILYCGPSNKSVDVIAMYLEKYKKKLNLRYVRVYSDAIEQQSFPIPGEDRTETKFSEKKKQKKDVPIPKEIKNNALHYIIRSKEAGKDGEDVKEKYGDIFKSGGSQSSITEYKETVKKAKMKMLKSYDIILCTCNAAGHYILRENLNIVQCIIDEAGMCFELDNLIPLVSHQPEQVVFIGDHKQLRPIIQNPRARQLRADKSLMEKFHKEAYTLEIQYRMHEEICKFPSREFYGGKLRTDRTVRDRVSDLKGGVWPAGEGHPHVFCHIEGEEFSQTVRTSYGNELSKSNGNEAYEVVRIAQCLTEKHKVKEEDLVILSHYNLQCYLIKEKLDEAGVNVKVQTVIKSQGSEWKFVILSTVRSLPKDDIPSDPGKGWRRKSLGFIEDENQMNVGLTRAMQGLIIVGNKNLLMTCNKWKKLIEDYNATGSVVDAENFLQECSVV